MYRLFSSKQILNNVLTLASPYLKQKTALHFSTLKDAYITYLEKLQPYCPFMRNQYMFYANQETEKAFENYFVPEYRVPEAGLSYEPEIILYADPGYRREALEVTLNDLKQRDTIFSELFSLIMNTVFCTTSHRLGGTSVNPRYVGVMCAYYDMMAEKDALPELLIHEFTHNALFLDELRHGYYTDYKKLYDPASYVNANYRGMPIKLPFDRCLHSLIVSAEIILARDTYIGHQPRISQHLSSEEIIKRAKEYIAQIKANKAIHELMKERCHEVFETCATFFLCYHL